MTGDPAVAMAAWSLMALQLLEKRVRGNEPLDGETEIQRFEHGEISQSSWR